MFVEGGEVHPIRDSPGYSNLEDHARGRLRLRRRHEEQQREDYERETRHKDAARGYKPIAEEVRKNGGIAPSRDYDREDIPEDLRARPGRGLPPDEMAQLLGYDRADDMLDDLRRRRESAERGGVRIQTRIGVRRRRGAPGVRG